MKRIITLFICLLMMASCITKEINMEKMNYKGNTLVLNLDRAIGTGYEWSEVYKSDNLSIDVWKFESLNKDKRVSGGRGVEHIECSIKDNEEAYLIVKYARSWEHGADYETFIIKSNNNEIIEVEEIRHNYSSNIEVVYASKDDKELSVEVLKDYEYEERQDDTLGLIIKNNDGQFGIYYNPELINDMNEGIYKKDVKIGDIDYKLYENDTDFYLIGGNGICCVGEKNLNKLDVIKMLDSTRYEG